MCPNIKICITCAALGFFAVHLQAAPITTTYTYKSAVTSDGNGPLDLMAEINYDNGRSNAPIAVVMHAASRRKSSFAEFWRSP